MGWDGMVLIALYVGQCALHRGRPRACEPSRASKSGAGASPRAGFRPPLGTGMADMHVASPLCVGLRGAFIALRQVNVHQWRPSTIDCAASRLASAHLPISRGAGGGNERLWVHWRRLLGSLLERSCLEALRSAGPRQQPSWLSTTVSVRTLSPLRKYGYWMRSSRPCRRVLKELSATTGPTHNLVRDCACSDLPAT